LAAASRRGEEDEKAALLFPKNNNIISRRNNSLSNPRSQSIAAKVATSCRVITYFSSRVK
jgi:hypothetical protein